MPSWLSYALKRERNMSGNALKVIAIITMTIDHLAWVGIETYEQAETPTQIFLPRTSSAGMTWAAAYILRKKH